jgi:hypothetical protein
MIELSTAKQAARGMGMLSQHIAHLLDVVQSFWSSSRAIWRQST